MNNNLISDSVLLPSYYVQQIIKHVQNITGNGENFLQVTGFNSERLEQPMVNFNWQEFEQFILQAKNLTNANIALMVGKDLLINTHGSLGYVAMNCASIRQFVEVFVRFLPLRTDLVLVKSCVKNGFLRMQMQAARSLGEIERLVFEVIMLAIKNVFDYITMGNAQFTQVAFSFPKNKNFILAQNVFACELLYDQSWTGFAFPLEEVDKPLLIADKDAFEKAAKLCREELQKLYANAPLNEKIMCLMLKKQGTLLTFGQVANILNLSERTMSRLLQKENVRFGDITQKVKYQMTLDYLNKGLQLQEAGFLLGYKNTSNFRRAFRRWNEQEAQSWGSSK